MWTDTPFRANLQPREGRLRRFLLAGVRSAACGGMRCRPVLRCGAALRARLGTGNFLRFAPWTSEARRTADPAARPGRRARAPRRGGRPGVARCPAAAAGSSFRDATNVSSRACSTLRPQRDRRPAVSVALRMACGEKRGGGGPKKWDSANASMCLIQKRSETGQTIWYMDRSYRLLLTRERLCPCIGLIGVVSFRCDPLVAQCGQPKGLGRRNAEPVPWHGLSCRHRFAAGAQRRRYAP